MILNEFLIICNNVSKYFVRKLDTEWSFPFLNLFDHRINYNQREISIYTVTFLLPSVVLYEVHVTLVYFKWFIKWYLDAHAVINFQIYKKRPGYDNAAIQRIYIKTEHISFSSTNPNRIKYTCKIYICAKIYNAIIICNENFILKYIIYIRYL